MQELTMIRDLLASEEHAQQAVELLRILAADEGHAQYEALLTGAEWNPGNPRSRFDDVHGYLTPGPAFKSLKLPRSSVRPALHALLADAPRGVPSADRLRQEITTLRVDSEGWSGPVNLDDFMELPRLERLSIRARFTGERRGFRALRELRLEGEGDASRFADTDIERVHIGSGYFPSNAPADRLDWLRRLPRLAALSFETFTGPPRVVGALRTLEELELGQSVPAGLGGLPKLRRLRALETSGGPYNSIRGAPALEELEVGNLIAGEHAPVDLPALRRFVCTDERFPQILVPSTLPSLREVTGFTVDDLLIFALCPKLEVAKLAVRSEKVRKGTTTRFGGYVPTAAQLAVHLDETIASVDLTALAAARHLRVLHLHQLEVPSLRDLPLPDATCATIEDLAIVRARLRSLDGLERFPNLRRLVVSQNPIETLDGLGAAPHLRLVGLGGCTELVDVSALDALHDLRAVMAAGTALVAKDLPKRHQWTLNRQNHAKPDELADRERPEPAPTKRKAPKG